MKLILSEVYKDEYENIYYFCLLKSVPVIEFIPIEIKVLKNGVKFQDLCNEQ